MNRKRFFLSTGLALTLSTLVADGAHFALPGTGMTQNISIKVQ